MGLVTRKQFADLREGIGEEGEVAVYFPMSYQIGGFTLIMPKDRIQPVDMTMDQAMRFALTAGVTSRKDEDELNPSVGPCLAKEHKLNGLEKQINGLGLG